MGLQLLHGRKLAPASKSGGLSIWGQPGMRNGCVRFDAGLQAAEAVTNLITNPSFEIDLTGWTQGLLNGTVLTERRTEQAVYGIACVKFNVYSTSASGYVSRYTASVAAAPADVVTTQAFVYAPIMTALRYRLRIHWQTAASAEISVSDSAIVSASNAAFTPLSFTATAPATTAKYVLDLLVDWISSGSSGVVYWDAIQSAKLGYDTPYCDGSLPGCTWSGTAHASTSSRTAPTLYYNVTEIGDSLTLAIRYRTPPAFRGTGNKSHMLCDIYNGSDSKNRLIVRHHETGAFVVVTYDVGGNSNTQTGATPAADTEYVMAVTLERSGANTLVKTYYALGTATAFTADISATATGIVRQAEATRLNINTHGSDATYCGNHIIDDIQLCRSAVSLADLNAWLAAGGVGPLPGCRYYGAFNDYEDYCIEEVLNVVSFDCGRFAVRVNGYTPVLPASPDALVENEAITFKIDAQTLTMADLMEARHSLESLLHAANTDDALAPVSLLYSPQNGGRQGRARVHRLALRGAESWSSLIAHTRLVELDAQLTLTRDNFRGGLIRTLDSQTYTNSTASPITVLRQWLRGQMLSPARVCVENVEANGYTDAYITTLPKFGTPAVMVFDIGTGADTVDASALGGKKKTTALTTAYATVASFAVTVDRRYKRRYKALVKFENSDVGKLYDFRLTYGAATYNDDRIKLCELFDHDNAVVDTHDPLFEVGDFELPPDGEFLGDPGTARTVTLYLGCRADTGTPNAVIDYVVLIPVGHGWNHPDGIDATKWISTGSPLLLVDPDKGRLGLMDATRANLDLLGMDGYGGGRLLLDPREDNYLYIWCTSALEYEHARTWKWWAELYPLYWALLPEVGDE